MNWLDVVGYDGRYEVNDEGQVRRTSDGYVLRPHTVVGGYLRVTLSGGSQRNVLVHCLIAAAFLGPRPEGMEVDHVDGNTYNNKVSNLRYLTPSDNVRAAFASGRRRPARGEAHASARLTEGMIHSIRRSSHSRAQLARTYGVNKTTIDRIINRKTWRHI